MISGRRLRGTARGRKGCGKSGFAKMAEEHEQIAQAIERSRQQQTK